MLLQTTETDQTTYRQILARSTVKSRKKTNLQEQTVTLADSEALMSDLRAFISSFDKKGCLRVGIAQGGRNAQKLIQNKKKLTKNVNFVPTSFGFF